ncbi:MAG TPA: hypothetical protein VG123_24675 [Streptosporangiaceae bacterium]|nr:hypothetical protein [Streptosporangiaceae bacterium]
MGSPLRTTPARILAVTAALAFLAACGTAAVPAAGTGNGTGPRHGPGTSPGTILAASEAQAPGAGTGTGHTAIRPPPAASPAAGGTTVPGAPNCPMFPASNVWNTDISQLPVDAHSAAWLRSMDSASTSLHPDFGPDPGGFPYGIPYNVVTNSHPLVPITFQYASESDKGPYPFGPDTLIEGGKNAGGDRHAIMVNSGTCTLYELWDARYSASGATAGSGAIWKLTSNRLRPAGWTSADAAGLPILPGLLNYSQVKAAVRSGRPITHAIRFTAQSTQSAYLWPARHEAGSGANPSLPPMGARFRLKAGFNVAGFCATSAPYCADAQAVLTEMQHYGLILADNGSNWFFQGSAYPQWPDALVSLLKQIPARDFQAVDESCLMVSPNSGRAAAKPGCPIG